MLRDPYARDCRDCDKVYVAIRFPWFELNNTSLALQPVVTSGLSSIDVEHLPCHKPGAIQVEHRLYDVGHISHPTHWMECRQCLVRFGRIHGGLYYSRRHGVHADSGLCILNGEGLGCRAQRPLNRRRTRGLP
jgi:hypothetical protein